jgi:hypothetical protein
MAEATALVREAASATMKAIGFHGENDQPVEDIVRPSFSALLDTAPAELRIPLDVA